LGTLKFIKLPILRHDFDTKSIIIEFMHIYTKIFTTFAMIFLISCSSSYKELSKIPVKESNNFSSALFNAYKEKADFEAIKMHDWNSAKLYSEKAIKAYKGKIIFPEKIDNWDIPNEKNKELTIAYNNLMTIYNDALTTDPLNLANAITSLDCWSEQLEEEWQTWDINKCRDEFMFAMHNIFNNINKEDKKNEEIQNKKEEVKLNGNTTLITQDSENNILQLVYFDFNKSNLTGVNKREIKNFIIKNIHNINNLIVVGHTDTVGTKEYNLKLSVKRALIVKNFLIEIGINSNKIQILGKGEAKLLVKTRDKVAHPANRRAEIKPLN
jgi:OOP family OmpA-OmpF porin